MAGLSKQHGDQWEAYVRAECKEVHRRRQAKVSKNWEAPKVKGSHVSWEQSKPDYSGYDIATGKHIVFEAKATRSTTRFDLKNLTDGQREHLTDASFAGALAFVYVLTGDQRKLLIPMRLIESAEGASVNFETEGVVEKYDRETWFDAARRLE